MDRMDIQKYVGVVDFFEQEIDGVSSADIRHQVEQARALQQERYRGYPDISCNAQLTPSLLKKFCDLDKDSHDLLKHAYRRFHYSGRSLHKFIKIARTIADLEGEERIQVKHMKKSLRSRDIEKDTSLLQP